MIDSHTHLDRAEFDADRDEVLARSRAAGVDGWIIPAVSIHSARCLLAAPWRTPRVWPAVGIHPQDVKNHGPGDIEEMESLLLSFPDLVAIGETGVDFFYDLEHADAQLRFFESQLELGEKFQKPVIVHARDGNGRNAYAEIMECIRDRKVTGVLHCFNGSTAVAEEAVSLGWMLGVGGIATFKQTQPLRDTLRAVPIQNMILETDAPYLAPVPFRGKRNEPSYLVKTLAVLAELKGIPTDACANQLTLNTQRLFKLT